jgi:hypothetical protein
VRQSHDSYGGGGQLNLNLKQRMNYHFANQPQQQTQAVQQPAYAPGRGGINQERRYLEPASQANYSNVQLASLNPKDKKRMEREERHRREREELEQMQSYNPFGKAGAGAPYRDENGQMVSRRPYSVLRDQTNQGPTPGRNAYINQSVSNAHLQQP